VIHDDSIREIHGVNAHQPDAGNAPEIILDERETVISLRLAESRKARLTPWQARYLARKLYSLARRIENRTPEGA
jgi:hypothetical protein